MRLKLVPSHTRIPFMAARRITIPVSVAAMLGSVLLILTLGLNLGVDFRGGTMLMLGTPQATDIGVYRQALGGLGLGEVTVTEISGSDNPAAEHQAVVRIAQQEGEAEMQQATLERVQEALKQAVPGLSVLSVESVGGKVSGELIWSGIIATVLAILATQIYIWARFEWQFSLGASASLVHDVVLTIGLFSLLQLEFNLSIVAAILTIIGYSLNDTVVIFDRVREYLRKYKKMDLAELIDLSTNDTLSRTVMTAGTTLLALVSLYILGGEVIRGFTFAMIWGVLIGTYSSVFVANLVVYLLGVERGDKPSSKAGTQFSNIDA
ncbi:MAG TPA: protein translocase subunit SecF [Paracoccaceae bacterium]|nr:protein translocase subunit SecF [Paracoccaceae bacterium]